VALVDYLPPEPKVSPPDDMKGAPVETYPVVVYVAGSEAEAYVIKGRLESEGIPAMLQGESLQAIGATHMYIGGIRVLVPESLAEAARDLIREDPEG